MDKLLLKQLIADGYVAVNKHPDAHLYIYNYTQKTQYERLWNECTLMCRGLILDENFRVVARPFSKFFNLEELENHMIPNEPFDVFEKMDGSLGILYWLDGKPQIASRGSFTSEQAITATTFLHTYYSEIIPFFDTSKTYLFEIIYPENRIVVDYGMERQLVLLAIIDTQTGIEENINAFKNTSLPVVNSYDGLNDLAGLKKAEIKNKEGFVVKFKSGYRLKVKFNEYQRIHRIVTNVSSYTIWEFLQEGKSLEPLLDRVPDEFYQWLREVHTNLLNKFAEIEQQAMLEFKVLEDRKETATYFQTCCYPAVLFKMLDKKPYKSIIWKLIKPSYHRPFASQSKP